MRAEYGLLSARDVSTYVYSFPNGGTIGYNDVLNTTVLDTFMTPSQFDDYVWKKVASDIITGQAESCLSDLFSAMGITFGPWGAIYQFLSGLSAVVTASAINDVRNNGGWGEQIAVSASGGAETSCVLITWSSHPNAIIPGTATNIKPEAF